MPEIHLGEHYCPQAKQTAFHTNSARYRLMVGGAGSGKSVALLWEAVKWAYAYPGIQILLLRRNFPELNKGLIADLHDQVPRELYHWNDSKHIATFDIPGSSTSKIYFGHLDSKREKALAQYLSSAFPLIGIDEVGQFTYPQWEFLTVRNRVNPGCTGNPVPGMMGATNPLGPGWGFLRDLFVDHKPPIELGGATLSHFNRADYWYIHSTIFDNEAYLTRDPTYLIKLQSLRPALRDKFLYGMLDSVAGQFFTSFQPAVHVQPASAFTFQPWERSWIGLDWGLAHYASVLWFTRAYHLSLKRSVTVCYRERQFRELSIADAADLIRSATSGPPAFRDFHAERKSLTSVFASHELFARHTDPQKSQTIAAEFSRDLSKLGMPGLLRAAGSSSRNERIRGAAMIYEDFAQNELFILDSCPTLAASLPTLIHDEDDIEDVLKTDTMADDIFDSLKHGLLSVSQPRKEPAVQLIEHHAQTISDPLSRWFYLTKHKSSKDNRNLGSFLPLWQQRLR
ncbi:MAG: phage terminase large subunit [Terriglobia bacterium]